MSGSSHLNIDITANSTAAAARIKELEEQIKLLRANITAIGTDSSRMGQQLVLSMQQGIAAAQATISALKGETAAINEVTQALERQGTVAANTARQMAAPGFIRPHPPAPPQSTPTPGFIRPDTSGPSREQKIREEIRLRNMAVEAQRRQEDAAIAAAHTEAEYINRDMDLVAAKARAEAEYVNQGMDAQAAKARAEAEYANRDLELIRARQRAEAEYINQGMTATAARERAEAEYLNRDLDLIAAKQRAEAEYINAGMTAEAAKARAEAEYANRNLDLIRARQRAEAEYINQGMDASAARSRAEAEYINRNHDLRLAAIRHEAEEENRAFDARARREAASAHGIIAAHPPSAYAAKAAAAAALGGASFEEAQFIGAEALTKALEQQKAVISSVAAAMAAAGRAGASASEIEIAGARAATEAYREQVRAVRATATVLTESQAQAGVAGFFQRESRHIVGMFDSLASGHRGQFISSMGAAARDAGLGVAGLVTSLGALVAVMGTAAFFHSAEALGKWATETRAAASAAGMGIGAYSRLQGALRISGLSATEADSALRHVAETLSTAIADPASKAAEAYTNLGISQKQLAETGGDVGKIIALLAEAWVRNADGANKSANMTEIAGREFAKLIPLLQNGEAGLKAQGDAADKLGVTLTEKTAKSLEEVATAIRSLGETIRGDGIRAMENWGPVIITLVGFLKEAYSEVMLLVGAIGMLGSTFLAAFSNPFQSYPEHVRIMLERAGKGPGRAGVPEDEDAARMRARFGKVQPPPLTEPITPVDRMHEEMRQAALKASEGEAQLPAGSAKVKKLREDEARAEIEIMKKTLADETLTAKARLQVREELAQKTIALNNMLAGAPGGSKSHQETTDYLAAIRLRVAEADGNSKKIIAIYDEEIAKLKQLVAAHKATMAQVSNAEREKVVEVNKARIQEIDTEAKDFEYKARLLDVNTKLASMAAGTFKYAGQKEGPGADQRTVSSALAEASQIQSFAAHQISELKEIQSTQEAGTRSYKETQDKINSIILDSKTKEEALYKKAGDAAVAAANKQAAAFTDFFDKLGSAFESFGSTMFDALIAPQKEIIKAGLSSKTISDQGSQMRAAVGQLLKSVAESAVKSIGEALSHTLANALTGGASNTIGEMLGKWMSSAVSSIAGNTAGAAAGSAVGQAAGGAVGDTAVVTAITTGATATTTGISGAIATLGATMDATAIASTTSIVSAITAAATAEDVLLAALNVKPSALGFTYASGGIVSAAGGMTVGGVGTQMAILHSQEMVLPAPISRGLQQMIARGQTGGGDSNTSNMANLNYNPTINARPGRGGSGMSRGEFSTMMGLHSGAMLGQARNMMRNGWRPA